MDFPPSLLVNAYARVNQAVADVDQQRASQRNDRVEHLDGQNKLKVVVVELCYAYRCCFVKVVCAVLPTVGAAVLTC